MSFLEALILGIIQGLTEFLPVSSSGHIELVKGILKTELKEGNMLMTVVVHFATALSTIVIFRKDIAQILGGLFQFKNNEQLHFSLKIILSMIPAAFVGVMFDDIIDGFFEGQYMLVGFMLIITALLLYFADRAKNTTKDVSYLNAFVVGIAQAIAILPGISRSGATISASVLLGIDRSKAARFSFLMVVPLILGKMGKDVLSDDFTTAGVGAMPLAVGFVAAFITGLFACTWMIAIVKKSKLTYFAVYCLIVGVLALIFLS
jgi:undecaprenyl-diphosphatase